MHTDAEDMSLEARARRRVALKTGFYTHLLVFVLVNLGLWLLSFADRGPWVHHWGWPFPLWGWGIGLAIHGLVTFLKLNGEGLRDRMLADEIERLKRREQR